jgi:hypothetical protein
MTDQLRCYAVPEAELRIAPSGYAPMDVDGGDHV